MENTIRRHYENQKGHRKGIRGLWAERTLEPDYRATLLYMESWAEAMEQELEKGATMEEAVLKTRFQNAEAITLRGYDAEFNWEHHVRLRDTLAACKGKWLVSQADCPEIRELFRDYEILDFQRIHSMVQKHAPGKQFHELLIGNYDLLEREREVPMQMSLNELLGEPINVEQILKERITSCKNRTK